MNEPTWKLVNDIYTGQPSIVWREWPDGTQESCQVTAEAYLLWLAEGNTPSSPDEAVEAAE
jgi:hypothetical protein